MANAATKEFVDLLQRHLQDAGKDFGKSAKEVAEYAATRAQHLSTMVNDPDFLSAVKAERDAVALFAGIQATNSADAIDNRVVGIIQAALALGARLLVAA